MSEEIRAAVEKALSEDPGLGGRNFNVFLKKKGFLKKKFVIELVGHITEPELSQRAEEIAKKLGGGLEVENKILNI